LSGAASAPAATTPARSDASISQRPRRCAASERAALLNGAPGASDVSRAMVRSFVRLQKVPLYRNTGREHSRSYKVRTHPDNPTRARLLTFASHSSHRQGTALEMLELVTEPLSHFLRPSDRVYWAYLAGAAVIAFAVYLKQNRKTSLKGFAEYLLPKSIWRHASTRTDIAYFLVNRILFLALFMPFLVTLYPAVNHLVHELLAAFFAPQNLTASGGIVAGYALTVLLAIDFVRFLAHYLQHKVDFLWQFHKVHHSAAVLTPLTVYRVHPVDDFLALTLGSVVLATLHGAFSFLFVNDVSFWTFGNVSLVTIAFYLAGYNLRHSHVWLSYGRVLERWLMSPAQHQIHHSCRPEHVDRNMGFILSVWDRLFGTLYVPASGREDLTLGIAGEPEHHFASSLDCYVRPFRANLESHAVATLSLAALMIGAASFSIAPALATEAHRSVRIEELTWKEVETLIAAGYKSAIIPTGGVEQNGEHLILGKHNPIITEAATRIAVALGDALVAPTVSYVPEGRIEPPDGHMTFPGTLSVREETFEALITDTARSLIQHGFTRICLVGDSGGNQASQERVAAALNDEYGGRGVVVIHADDYYYRNGQREWLAARGFSDTDIGGHAGVRDSSELLYVQPGGVRLIALHASGQALGVSGAYWKSSREIGAALLDLKVRAALAQIERESAPPGYSAAASSGTPAKTR
jgi:sterol desaturase/sphingolipid hydroxylase (fatty acid hydroxylase superfamily)/creatinine amidohydrolase/Fe(II)-dependent formamide hydrolase-like protein